MDIVTRQKLIILIQLAKADGEFADSEKQLIEDIAERHNFSGFELKKLFYSTESFESLGALSNAKKSEYLLDCLRLVMVDGKIKPAEITFCEDLAVKLGYNKDVVAEALKEWPNPRIIDFSQYKIM